MSQAEEADKTVGLLDLFSPPPNAGDDIENDSNEEAGEAQTSDEQIGSDSYLMNLFAPAARSSPYRNGCQESTPLMAESSSVPAYSLDSTGYSSLMEDFLQSTPKATSSNDDWKHTRRISTTGPMPSIQESVGGGASVSSQQQGRLCETLSTVAKKAVKGTTLIGSFVYLLYHIVFCLALGSAINRPNNPTSILGLMTKMAALGPISSSFVYW